MHSGPQHGVMRTQDVADLVQFGKTVCANGRHGQGIMQRLHQLAPALLVWNMLH